MRRNRVSLDLRFKLKVTKGVLLLARRCRTGNRRRTSPRCCSRSSRRCRSWRWCWCYARLQLVGSTSVLWRRNIAEVVGKKLSRPLHACCIEISDFANRAIDHIKAHAGIVLIQSHLEIPRLRVVFTVHHVPLDVKDPVGGVAGNRREDAASVCPSRTTGRAPRVPLMPERKDGEVIWTVIGWRRRASFCIACGLVVAYKIEPPTGGNVHSGESLIIQHKWERQRDQCVAPSTVIARVGGSWHDVTGALRYRVLGAACPGRGSRRRRSRRRCARRGTRRPFPVAPGNFDRINAPTLIGATAVAGHPPTKCTRLKKKWQVRHGRDEAL